MDTNQTRIVELLREVHLIAFKEIERLSLRIAELENQKCEEPPANKPTPAELKPLAPPSPNPSPEVLNEKQVAAHLNISLGTIRRWRTVRQGPPFVKIGSAVRYKRQAVEAWLESCSQ